MTQAIAIAVTLATVALPTAAALRSPDVDRFARRLQCYAYPAQPAHRAARPATLASR